MERAPLGNLRRTTSDWILLSDPAAATSNAQEVWGQGELWQPILIVLLRNWCFMVKVFIGKYNICFHSSSHWFAAINVMFWNKELTLKGICEVFHSSYSKRLLMYSTVRCPKQPGLTLICSVEFQQPWISAPPTTTTIASCHKSTPHTTGVWLSIKCFQH